MLISSTCFSQILKPVKWNTSVEKITDTEYNLVFTAMIDEDWHLYALDIPNNGPIPTSFGFDKTSKYRLIGEVSQEEGITVYDETFKMEVTYFINKTTFKQRIKKAITEKIILSGNINYMSCTEEKCIPSNSVFEIEIP